MLILASDTTGKSLSVALVRDGHLVGESRFNLGYNHAVTHLPQVMSLLEACEVCLDDVDLLAVTSGPGSFTGTRIGLSSFKAMAYAAQKPLVGVSTLETLAWNWRHQQQALICPMLDARNGRVYAACYPAAELAAIEFHPEPKTLVKPGNYQIKDFLTELAFKVRQSEWVNAPVLLTGDGASVALAQDQATQLDTAMQPELKLIRLDPLADAPSAAMVASLAADLFAAGVNADPFQVNATYLTPSSAERLSGKQTDQ